MKFSLIIRLGGVFQYSLSFVFNLTTLWAISADNKLMISYFFPQKNRLWQFMQTVTLGKQFAWNVKAYFLGKIRKTIQNVVYWIMLHIGMLTWYCLITQMILVSLSYDAIKTNVITWHWFWWRRKTMTPKPCHTFVQALSFRQYFEATNKWKWCKILKAI